MEIETNNGNFSPEEYASFWGADPQYCHAPQLPSDGYLFYNFGSSIQKRDKQYLNDFIDAINRLIESVSLRPVDDNYTDDDKQDDLDGLAQLLAHVKTRICE